MAWNTDLVREDDIPGSWDDLLKPKWNGRLGMQDPLQGGGAGIWVVTMYELWGEEKWDDWMRRLGAQRLKYGRYLEVREMLTSGEIAVQLVAYPSYTQPLISKGAPIQWGLFDPVLFTGRTLNLSKNSKNVNAGKLYIDFVLSREGQQVVAQMNEIPALAELMPDVYKPIGQAKLVPQAHELEMEKFDYFQEKMREYFVR
jgi:iron(III) transport system substrate-binding protein